jgi:hypothetical protein
MPKTLIVAAGGRVSRRVAAALYARGGPPRFRARLMPGVSRHLSMTSITANEW